MDGEERLHSTHTASGAVPVDRFVCRGVRQGEGFYSLRCSPVWYGRGGLVWCGMFWRNDDGSRQKWCFDQWQLSNGAFVFPWVHCLGLALVSLGMSPTAMIRGTQIQKVDGLSMSRVLEAMFVVQFLQTTAETTESNYLRQDNKRERERERDVCHASLGLRECGHRRSRWRRCAADALSHPARRFPTAPLSQTGCSLSRPLVHPSSPIRMHGNHGGRGK
jgi:hypothetical protein